MMRAFVAMMMGGLTLAVASSGCAVEDAGEDESEEAVETSSASVVSVAGTSGRFSVGGPGTDCETAKVEFRKVNVPWFTTIKIFDGVGNFLSSGLGPIVVPATPNIDLGYTANKSVTFEATVKCEKKKNNCNTQHVFYPDASRNDVVTTCRTRANAIACSTALHAPCAGSHVHGRVEWQTADRNGVCHTQVVSAVQCNGAFPLTPTGACVSSVPCTPGPPYVQTSGVWEGY